MGYALVLAVAGPSALAVTRAGMTGSYRVSLAAALGVASGTGIASTIAALGASAIPAVSLWSRLGAFCLALLMCRTAFKLLRTPLRSPDAPQQSPRAYPAAFVLGAAAALGNPVSVPWFLVFFVSHSASEKADLVACALIFSMALIWFGCLGCAIIRVCAAALAMFRHRALNQGVAAGCLFIAVRTVWTGLAH